MKFTHLHVHSHYSLLDGLTKIDDLLDYVKKLGMDSVALTDHGVLYGAVEFYKKAKQAGIKPIIGCEVYMAYEKMTQKRPNIDDKRYHLVLLVKNKEGYKNLVKLVTESHLKGFYYKPRIDDELLAKHSSGLIALTACIEGKIPQLILANKIKQAENYILKYKKIFGEGNFYLEIQDHPNIKRQKKLNDILIKLSKKLDVPLVATNDSHYLRPEDAEAQDILMLINTGAKPDDPERLTMKDNDFSLKTPEQMSESFKDVPESIKNTQKIKDLCNFDFKLGKTKLPYFETPLKENPDIYLEKLCKQGISKKYGKFSKGEVNSRLEYELSIIKETGFASYFLIVSDFVNWAKENRIVVGPGRGSVGGSIVAYLLNITTIDPLKHDLLFERFLNLARVSMPDIDLDFTDRRRDEVINYVSEKYGRNKVAQIITFGTMAARAVIRDVGRATGIEYSYCDKLAKMIPFGSNLKECLEKVSEFRQLYKTDKTATELIDFALKLEGCARHASTHACGVVISKEPLDEIVPLQHPTQNDHTIVTQYEMHSIEDLGLLKIDLLGLKNLTIIEDTLARIYKVQNKKIDIEELSLDDKKTYKIFQNAETTGVFQLECLSGDTIVSNTTIKKLFERKNKKVLESVYLDEGKIHKTRIINVLEGDKKELYTLIAENNSYIKASKDHHFLTENGWKKLEDINLGEKVLMKTQAKHLVFNTCKICGKQINGQKEGKSNFCYKCSARFYKNPSKKDVREKIKAARIRFYQQGGKPWNYGMTTKNNEIWKKTAEKISKALKGRTFEETYGYEKANEMKKKLSIRSSGENNPMFGRPSPHRKGGFRKDLGHYVRSNWEADFARILKLHNLKYQYEVKTFRLVRANGEIIHYTPDFYVQSNNTFYEIKGWMHELDKEKIELFQEQYPQYNFVLISATKFAELALKYKTLINWECPQIPLKNSFRFVKIKTIKYSGREKTYDILMKTPGNNFVANSFLVHNSDGMKRYLKELKPSTFEDIVAMVALYRPGPMQFIPEYIERKNKRKKTEYIHPKLKPILQDTYGICIFQEQLMQIVRVIAGFSLAEADILRKAIGKKIEKLLFAQKEKFIKGTVNNKIKKEIGEKIWNWILPFARYGFNRAHATAYAKIAYQTAYLKAHFPVEFMSALLTSEKTDLERIAYLIEECKNMQIDVLPPDINESFRNFSVVPNEQKIRFGLLAIKNVGSNIVEAIIKERKNRGKFKSIIDFISRIDSKDLNKRSLESLIKTGAFDNFEERNKLLSNMEEILDFNRETRKAKTNGQKSLFHHSTTNSTPSFKLKDEKPLAMSQKLLWEKELLGLYISSHPLKDFENILSRKTISIKDLKAGNFPYTIRVGGVILSVKKILTKKGKPMLFVKLEDLTDKIEVIVFSSTIEKNPTAFQENKIVFITGRIDTWNNTKKIICEDIEEIIEK